MVMILSAMPFSSTCTKNSGLVTPVRLLSTRLCSKHYTTLCQCFSAPTRMASIRECCRRHHQAVLSSDPHDTTRQCCASDPHDICMQSSYKLSSSTHRILSGHALITIAHAYIFCLQPCLALHATKIRGADLPLAVQLRI